MKLGASFKETALNPSLPELDEDVFFLLDGCHLLKLARNAFAALEQLACSFFA